MTIERDSQSTHWPDSATELSGQDVGRLIYASVSNVEESVLDEMRRVRDRAVINNQRDGIRVMLMHKCGWFVQWMEGPPEALKRLVERVSFDKRHHGLKVVHESVGEPRLFKPWIGSIAQSTESSSEFGRRVIALRERFMAGKGYEPASVWRTLCSPLPGHVEVAAALEGQYQRVMMMSAEKTTAFDFIHWLANETQRTVVHRRFAGAAQDALDVESDYLDLPDQARRGRRLIVNARKGLAMGMTHAFLPDYAAVVLLVGQDPVQNASILRRLMVTCRQVHHRPVMIGLGPDPWFSPELTVLAEEYELRWIEAGTGEHIPDMATLWWALRRELDRLANE